MFSYPPQELWPEKIYNLPDLSYPDTFNASYELLDANLALGRGSAPAIYAADAIITYTQLADDVTKIAGSLRQQGVQAGDGVLIRLLNRPHFIATFLAVLRIGAVALPTAPLLRHREISAIIENADPTLLVSETDLWDEVRKIEGIKVRCINVEELRNGPPYRECAPTPQDAAAIILHTSGSTGAPKGCMHSHADLAAVCDSYAGHILQPSPADRFGGHPTMAFAYGLGGLLLFPLRFGATTVLLDRFTPAALAETIEKHKVSIAFCAPTSLRMMMNDCPDLKRRVASLRYAISAGETLPASVYAAWSEKTGIEVLDAIGSTEMLHVFISGMPGRTRPGVTGEVVPGYEARVVDEQTMKTVSD